MHTFKYISSFKCVQVCLRLNVLFFKVRKHQLPKYLSRNNEILPVFIGKAHGSALTTICIPLQVQQQLSWLSKRAEYSYYFPFSKFANTKQTDSSNTWQAHSGVNLPSVEVNMALQITHSGAETEIGR